MRRGVAWINELPYLRLLTVFEEGIEAGCLYIDRRSEAQFDELAAADAAREGGAKALIEDLGGDLDGFAIDKCSVKAGNCGGFNGDLVEAILGRRGPQEVGKQGLLARHNLEGEHLADDSGGQWGAEVDG